MKKTIIILLSLMMLASSACAARDAANVTPAAAAPEEPAQTAEPEPAAASVLPLVYDVYQEVGFSVSEAEMFRYDIDGDGKEEVISFRLDEDNYDTEILIDDRSVLFDESSMLSQVILIDLDPSTPWINLLVEIDWASDDYFTTEVHLENGSPVKGAAVGGVYVSGSTQLRFERTDFLGTRSGSCSFHGEKMEADSEWYNCHVPSEEEIVNERDSLIEYGDLYHTVKEVPCTINGKDAKIAADSYIYMTRFNPAENLAEVRTLDGVTAVISYTDSEYDHYLIGGVPQDELFDNLFFAD